MYYVKPLYIELYISYVKFFLIEDLWELFAFRYIHPNHEPHRSCSLIATASSSTTSTTSPFSPFSFSITTTTTSSSSSSSSSTSSSPPYFAATSRLSASLSLSLPLSLPLSIFVAGSYASGWTHIVCQKRE